MNLPDPDFPEFGAPPKVLIISPSGAVRSELIALLERHRPGHQLIEFRSYPDVAEIKSFLSETTRFCFLDTISNREQALELLVAMLKVEPGLGIINLLSGNDPDLILRSLRMGAADFLLRPFSGDQLEAALEKVERMLPAEAGPRKERGKLYAVMPAKGACGASTLACNLAYQWKRYGATKRILLADLDPLTGIISFLLKIKTMHSFANVLARASELDSDLWKAMVSQRQGVDVLLAPENATEAITGDFRNPTQILEYARDNYDVAFLDSNGVYGEWNLRQAQIADEVLLVTTNELPALQAAQRSLSYLDENRVGRWKIKLIVSRFHPDIGLNKDVISTALGMDVFQVVPNDYEAVQKGLMEGKAIPPASSFGKALAHLSDQLYGKDKEKEKAKTEKKPGTFLGRLFGS